MTYTRRGMEIWTGDMVCATANDGTTARKIVAALNAAEVSATGCPLCGNDKADHVIRSLECHGRQWQGSDDPERKRALKEEIRWLLEQ